MRGREGRGRKRDEKKTQKKRRGEEINAETVFLCFLERRNKISQGMESSFKLASN